MSSSLNLYLLYTHVYTFSLSSKIQSTPSNSLPHIQHIHTLLPSMNSTTSPDVVKMQAPACAESNDNELFFVDLNPTPITPTLPYPALDQKNEIVDLINEPETEQIDLTDDIPTIPTPSKTPGKQIPGKSQPLRAGQGPTRLKINVSAPSTSPTAHKVLGSRITKKKVIKRESSASSTSSLEFVASNVLNEEVLDNSRSVSPESRVSRISIPSYTPQLTILRSTQAHNGLHTSMSDRRQLTQAKNSTRLLSKSSMI